MAIYSDSDGPFNLVPCIYKMHKSEETELGPMNDKGNHFKRLTPGWLAS